MPRSPIDHLACSDEDRLRRVSILPRHFYNRDPKRVARELIGSYLFVESPQGLCAGRIVESEAYLAKNDSACHAAKGATQKNAAMFGPPGHAYVYAIHSRWCFNVVTQREGIASAVLIRAIEPVTGLSIMSERRRTKRLLDFARGPARLCEALGIDRAFNHCDLTLGKRLWLAHDPQAKSSVKDYGQSVRIGVTSAEDLLLRYYLREHPFVSGPRRLRE